MRVTFLFACICLTIDSCFSQGIVIYRQQSFHDDSRATAVKYLRGEASQYLVTVFTEQGNRIDIVPGQAPVVLPFPNDKYLLALRKDTNKEQLIKRFPRHQKLITQVFDLWAVQEKSKPNISESKELKKDGEQKTSHEDVTIQGKVYVAPNITVLNPSEIRVSYEEGVITIPVDSLPNKLKEELNLTDSAASTYRLQAAEKAKLQKEQEQHDADIKAKQWFVKQVKTIREVESDQINYLNQAIIFRGVMDLSSYYNFGYRDAQKTHYAFTIRQGMDVAHAYMERERAANIRQQLLDAGGALKGNFSVLIIKQRYEKTSDLYVELVDVVPDRLVEEK